MTQHYVDRYKTHHESRRKKLFAKLMNGTAKIIEYTKRGWIFETLDGKYFISKRGNLVKKDRKE